MGKDKYFDKAFGKRPEEELFDIENDPECMTNLAYKDEYRDLKEKLKEALLLEMERTEDPRFYEKADFFDKCVFIFRIYRTYKYSEHDRRKEASVFCKNEKLIFCHKYRRGTTDNRKPHRRIGRYRKRNEKPYEYRIHNIVPDIFV
mgnify:CR=1 FL=1